MIRSVRSAAEFPLERKVLAGIRRSRLMQPGDRVGVAVSGGGDSVGLLLVLDALRGELGISLAILHLNHLLRSADSDADEAYVADLAQKLGCEFFCVREEVAATARREHLNLEDAGRRARYAFFERVAEEQAIARVAVGHTLDDQAETMLARLCRGTGLRGLAGIHVVRGLVVRPLLQIRRAEVREYLARRGVGWREDASNQDRQRLRARIRNGLLPIMEGEYSPSIALHLAELARQAQGEEALWEVMVENRFHRLALALSHDRHKQWSVSARDLLDPLAGFGGIEWPAAAQDAFGGRLIRRMAEQVCGAGNLPAARHVEQVRDLAAAGSSGQQLALPHGLTVTREFDRLIFSRPARSTLYAGVKTEPCSYEYPIHIPKAGSVNVDVPEIQGCYCVKVFDWPRITRETREGLEALDPACLHPTLILRNWHPGDAYWPAGGRRSRKVARMLMARRIPERLRRRWPVLTSGGEVVWARGLPPARSVAAGSDSQTAMIIEEVAP